MNVLPLSSVLPVSSKKPFIAAVVSLLLLLTATILFLTTAPTLVGGIDLLQYWAAARLLTSGGNPYDPSLLLEIQREASTFSELPVRMWNPPLILPALSVLSYFDFEQMRLLWFLVSVGIYGYVVLILNTTHGVASSQEVRPDVMMDRWSYFFLALVFYPAILSLSYGQISLFLLGALVAFLRLFSRDSSRGRSFLAGACLSITLWKPHLLFLCYLCLGIQAVKGSHERFALAGLCVGGALAAIVVYAQQPMIWKWYVEALKSPPYSWFTPTAGTFLQAMSEHKSPFLRYLPLLLGAMATILLTQLVRLDTPKLLLLLVPLSLFCSPYGWVYDQVFLLPTMVAMFNAHGTRSRRLSVRLLIFLFAGCYYLFPGTVGQHYFVFVPPALFLASLVTREAEVLDVSRRGSVP